MNSVDPVWQVSHFSVANPAGPERYSVAALLERVAAELRRESGAEVQDVVMHFDVDEFGAAPRVTVYFYRQ